MTRSVPSRDRRRDGLGAIDSVTVATVIDIMREETLNVDAGAQNGFTQVQRFEVAGLTLPPGTISIVRFTFQAGAGEGLIITNAYVGHAAAAGDAYDFLAAPTQITFNSGNAQAFMAAGAVAVSDSISFAYNKTSALLVAYYVGGGTSDDTIRYKTGLANVNHYSKAANDAATVNKTGYATNAGYVVGVAKAEADGF